MRSADHRANREWSVGRTIYASRATGAARPALKSTFNERETDEHNCRAGDKWGKYLLQQTRLGEGKCNFKKSAATGGAENGSVATGTW